jgi:5-methylcytosine-specific restriction enzyme A
MTNGNYAKWYKTTAWRARRDHQLKVEPLCRMCAALGKLTPATVVDHVEAHRGDYNLFALGALQSLCWDCHSRHKQSIDIHGYSRAVDASGWPLDPHHPSYGTNSERAGVVRLKGIPR